MIRDLPIRRVSSACPRTLLILCEPVWLRSSRLSSTRAPPACSENRRASVTGLGRPTYDESRPESSAWNASSCRHFSYAAVSSSSAATSASGTKRPPYVPKCPDASGTSEWLLVMTARSPVVLEGRVGAGRDQVGDGRPRVAARDQGLADEDGVGAGTGVLDDV